MITLTLPYPPTANNLYRNAGKGRVKSSGYIQWLADAAWDVRFQRPGMVKGRYRLSILATAPDRRARDADNLIKPVSDLLKKAGVIEEDSLAKSVAAEWSDDPPAKPGRCFVTIAPFVGATQ